MSGPEEDPRPILVRGRLRVESPRGTDAGGVGRVTNKKRGPK